jgi:hypothetical protein
MQQRIIDLNEVKKYPKDVLVDMMIRNEYPFDIYDTGEEFILEHGDFVDILDKFAEDGVSSEGVIYKNAIRDIKDEDDLSDFIHDNFAIDQNFRDKVIRHVYKDPFRDYMIDEYILALQEDSGKD